MGMLLYESVSCVCLWLSDEPVFFFVYMYEHLLYYSHVWMAPGEISCELTGSPSLNKVFELNWIEFSMLGFGFGIYMKCCFINVKKQPSQRFT